MFVRILFSFLLAKNVWADQNVSISCPDGWIDGSIADMGKIFIEIKILED